MGGMKKPRDELLFFMQSGQIVLYKPWTTNSFVWTGIQKTTRLFSRTSQRDAFREDSE